MDSWRLVSGDEGVRRFKLADSFVNSYVQKEVPWGYGALSWVTFKRTYARLVPGQNRTEEWFETCRRVVEGMFTIQKRHCLANGLPWDNEKAQRTAKETYDRLFTLKWTPPGRGLWMMGTEYIENRTGAGLFNCGFISTVDIAKTGGKAFAWAMDALMLGIGVGFDTKGEGRVTVQQPKTEGIVFEIPDSREGWVEALCKLLDSFLCMELPAITFDFSKIRKEGDPIKGFGGTSSGPQPLKASLEDIKNILTKGIGKPITSSMIVDIMNLIGRCVVAGNVRRSAMLSIGRANDKDYLELKDPTKFPEELRGWRWASNNSVECYIGMAYGPPADNTRKNGEPGFIWLDNARRFGRMKDPIRNDDLRIAGFNPCVEINLESGELCNVVETNPARHSDIDDFKRTLKIAYLYAKTVTLVNTHWPETNAIMLKNRRIGLSQTGIAQAIKKFGYRIYMDLFCDKAYEYVNELDILYSDWLCVPRSKKLTTVKPSGTVSLLSGSTPGLHYPEDEFYIRRIRIGRGDPLLETLKASGYKTEDCYYSKEAVVVEFPIHEPWFYRSKRNLSMWEQLELTAQMQHYWADNSVSVTITFDPEREASQIEQALRMYETKLKAVSFLPYNTHGYKQAPYEAITKEQYEDMAKDIIPMLMRGASFQGIGEKYCDGDKCVVPN